MRLELALDGPIAQVGIGDDRVRQPRGVGLLRPGSVVELSAEGMGTLRNPVGQRQVVPAGSVPVR